jgi:hypothetical protein
MQVISFRIDFVIQSSNIKYAFLYQCVFVNNMFLIGWASRNLQYSNVNTEECGEVRNK